MSTKPTRDDCWMWLLLFPVFLPSSSPVVRVITVLGLNWVKTCLWLNWKIILTLDKMAFFVYIWTNKLQIKCLSNLIMFQNTMLWGTCQSPTLKRSTGSCLWPDHNLHLSHLYSRVFKTNIKWYSKPVMWFGRRSHAWTHNYSWLAASGTARNPLWSSCKPFFREKNTLFAVIQITQFIICPWFRFRSI